MLSPQSITERTCCNNNDIDDAVGKRIAIGDGDNAKSCGSESDADVERPEVGGSRDTCARGGCTAYGECLEGGRNRAKACAEEKRCRDEACESHDRAEEEYPRREEQQPRIDGVVRSLAVEDASDEGACHEDGARIARIEEARLGGEPEAARIERDKGEDASVGEEENARDECGGKGTPLNECADGKCACRPFLRKDDLVGEFLPAARGDGDGGENAERGKERCCGEMFHEQKTDHRPHHHRQIRRESKVADALALAGGGENQCHKCSCRRRCNSEDNAVQEAQSVERGERCGKSKCRHDEEECHRNRDHQMPLVDGVDENAGKGARGDCPDLEECHGKPRLDIAAVILRHDDNGQRRNHGILRDIDEKIAQTHAKKLACPKFLCVHLVHGITFHLLFASCRIQYTTNGRVCKDGGAVCQAAARRTTKSISRTATFFL